MKRNKHLKKALILILTSLNLQNAFSEDNFFNRNYFSYLQQIGNSKFRLWIADNDQKRGEGLMGVFSSQLKSKEGMIFVYPYSKGLSFWMKNVPVPLDIAFINRNGYILNIERMIPYSLNFTLSKGHAVYAIEAKAGSLTKVLKVGQKLNLPRHLTANCR